MPAAQWLLVCTMRRHESGALTHTHTVDAHSQMRGISLPTDECMPASLFGVQVGKEWRWQTDDPAYLVSEALEQHRRMVAAMRGVPGVQLERLADALKPKHCALSLVGEPIMVTSPAQPHHSAVDSDATLNSVSRSSLALPPPSAVSLCALLVSSHQRVSASAALARHLVLPRIQRSVSGAGGGAAACDAAVPQHRRGHGTVAQNHRQAAVQVGDGHNTPTHRHALFTRWVAHF